MWEIFEQLRLQKGVSAYQVAKACGIAPGMFTNWKAGRYKPKADKIQKIADYFGVTAEYIMTGKGEYYVNPATVEKAQELFDDPNMRVLFDAARGSKPEYIQMAADLLERLKKTNPDG